MRTPEANQASEDLRNLVDSLRKDRKELIEALTECLQYRRDSPAGQIAYEDAGELLKRLTTDGPVYQLGDCRIDDCRGVSKRLCDSYCIECQKLFK